MKIAASVCVSMVVLGMGADSWAETVLETLSLKPGGMIEVSNVAGMVEVQAWSESRVEVKGGLGENQELSIDQTASGVRLEVVNLGDEDDFEDAELALKVPESARLVIEVVSADVTVSGLMSESIVVEAVSGDIEIAAQTRRLEISSVSGDLKFNGASDRAVLETVSGDIIAQKVKTEVSIRTVSGDATFTGAALERARAETVSGDFTLDMGLTSGGRLVAEALSGDITLNLPSAQTGEFRLQTFSGDIRSEFGPKQESRGGPGSSLRHQEGEGDALIRVESFSGDIEITKRYISSAGDS